MGVLLTLSGYGVLLLFRKSTIADMFLNRGAINGHNCNGLVLVDVGCHAFPLFN